MTDCIENDLIKVAVKKLGAELCSIRAADGTEYMWQADPSVWPRHAPILFPIVGALRKNKYYYNSKLYRLSRHGFARALEFNLIEQSATRLKYKLRSSVESLEIYPFRFSFRVTFEIQGSTLRVTYEVINKSRKIMPFSVGAHPAFSLNWSDNGNSKVEDYYIEWERPETLNARRLNAAGLLTDQLDPIIKDSRTLQLTEDLFNDDALVFLDMKSEKATLKSHKSDKQVTVEFPNFPCLGLWAKPGAKFVCIEPWCGHADTEDTDQRILVKHGIVHLDSEKSFSCTHKITVG